MDRRYRIRSEDAEPISRHAASMRRHGADGPLTSTGSRTPLRHGADFSRFLTASSRRGSGPAASRGRAEAARVILPSVLLPYVKSTAAAFATFVGLAMTLGTFWAILLGPVMDGVWDRLPGESSRWLGGGLMVFAVLSGLAVYFVVLARLVRGLGVEAGKVWRHVLPVGLVPPLCALAAIYAVVANLRFGW